MSQPTTRAQARTYGDIKPLVALCRSGMLYEAEEWIRAGKPVNLSPPEKGRRPQGPLQVAIDRGFHSLVRLLAKNGANVKEEWGYCALTQALRQRRFDIIKLLVDNGADPRSVSMEEVFESWQPEIMEYFIDRGADVETDEPLAWALSNRIRTALRIFKRYKDRFPGFQEQANIALRHHCKEGNLKWVSLMLWAGADPYAPGPADFDDDRYPEDDVSALEYAALYEHFDVFELKKIRLDPTSPAANGLLHESCRAKTADFMKRLLALGFNPTDQENGGASLYSTLIEAMSYQPFQYWDRSRRDMDHEEAREKMKMVHLLAKQGAKWLPTSRGEVDNCRRCLLKMTPDYTVEFVWIMSKYRACSREAINELLRTNTIRKHVKGHSDRIDELTSSLGCGPTPACESTSPCVG